jgi:hypothetical protein
MSQMRTVLSQEAETRRVPSGEKAQRITGPLWPYRMATVVAVATSQRRSVFSQEAETRRVPLGE